MQHPPLEGRRVRLEPLDLDRHLPGLTRAGLHPALWRWTVGSLHTPADMRGYVVEALAARGRGTAVPFATIDIASGRVVGSTRFGNIERAHGRAELGWTWIAPTHQRTGVNTEAKYLMLRHAFERWQLERVELKTDARNAPSRAAILRIGATQEGVLRRHTRTHAGYLRDTVYFSVVRSEWPEVKSHLERLMDRP